jgi:hypothetical protein
MSSKKQKKNTINKGHYLELMDRLYVAMSNINDHILEHPLTENETDIQSLVEESISNLWDAYQLVGNKEDSYENENHTH